MPPAPSSSGTNADFGRLFRAVVLAGTFASLRLRGLAGRGDTPNRAARVLGDEQGAILVHRDADRAAPDFGIADDKSGGEVVVLAGRHAVLYYDADDFVAGSLGSVPRPVFGGENIAAVLLWKLRPVIECQTERGRMGLQQHVGNGDFIFEIRPLAAVSRILIGADVVPGPAVESAFAHARDVVGRHVIAEPVALIGRAPDGVRRRRDGHADAVADAARKDALVLAVGIERQHIGAAGFAAPGGAERMAGDEILQLGPGQVRHVLGDIGAGAD